MPHDVSLPMLSRIQIASPCTARWESMTGDERERQCAQCDRRVYNLSAMSADAAETFLREKVGRERVCVRLYKRMDGTIITDDCPVGLRVWKRRAIGAASRVVAAAIFVATGGWAISSKRDNVERLSAGQPFRTICAWFNPKAAAPTPLLLRSGRIAVMGDVDIPRVTGPVRANGTPYNTVTPLTPSPSPAPSMDPTP